MSPGDRLIHKLVADYMLKQKELDSFREELQSTVHQPIALVEEFPEHIGGYRDSALPIKIADPKPISWHQRILKFFKS